MSIDISQHWAAGGTTPRHGPDRAGDRAGDRAPQRTAERAEAPTTEGHGPDESFGFGDVLDIVNPMHHLPVVGTVYRDLTGDDIKPVSRVLGAGVFGGPVGLASGVASAMIEETTGNDPMGHLYSAVTGRGSAQGDPDTTAQAAVAMGSAPAATTGDSPARHWAAGPSAAEDEIAQPDRNDGGVSPTQHWAERTASADQEPEQHAAVMEQNPTAQVNRETGQETVTFFPLGPSGSGPRTTTITRPEAPSPSAGRERSAGDSRIPTAGATGFNAASAVPVPAQSGGRMNDETEAVMRAMSMGLGAINPEAEGPEAGGPEIDDRDSEGQGPGGQNPGGQAANERVLAEPASGARPSGDAASRIPTGRQDDIASAMGRALDRYQTMDRGETTNAGT